MTRCTNPTHDHDEPAGSEVMTRYANASAVTLTDGMSRLTEDAPMRCADCGAPLHYDRGAETYVHDDPEVGCWLHRQGLPDDATPCVTEDPIAERMAQEGGVTVDDLHADAARCIPTLTVPELRDLADDAEQPIVHREMARDELADREAAPTL